MKIAFIGGGNMASAMITGILKSKLVKAKDICVSDRDLTKLNSFKEKGHMITDDNNAAVDFADYVFLTIKPQQYDEVLSNITNVKNNIFVTVAPGITMKYASEKLGGANVIRTMPNTPAFVGEGVTAITCSNKVNTGEAATVTSLLSSFSRVYTVDESKMDDIVALSGSGPAYAYMLIEAMAAHSFNQGINRQDAVMMAAQTVLGAAKMVLELQEMPETLCKKVCSTAGTTIAAVGKLNELGFKETISRAMDVCTKRAKELGGN